MSTFVVIAVIVVVATVLGLALRNRSTDDGVDSFRRQIDALSSEARKPTVDQVKSAERPDPGDADRDADRDAGRDADRDAGRDADRDDGAGGDVAGGGNTGTT